MSKGNTSRLLKANAIRSLGSKIVFDYHDLRRQCDEYVTKTRQEAQQIRDNATRDADEIRRRAHAEGRTAIVFGLQNCSPIEDDIGRHGRRPRGDEQCRGDERGQARRAAQWLRGPCRRHSSR